mmetsp:Transcript_17977/g.12996  ORF Transcript_17977/g.12996 Transcript_17977/m.12996 type:complete len:98 (+) Transcript_17977:1064-1357(+)
MSIKVLAEDSYCKAPMAAGWHRLDLMRFDQTNFSTGAEELTAADKEVQEGLLGEVELLLAEEADCYFGYVRTILGQHMSSNSTLEFVVFVQEAVGSK